MEKKHDRRRALSWALRTKITYTGHANHRNIGKIV